MLHYNKILYKKIYEEIYDREIEISDYKETILQINKDLVHIEFRILQAQNRYTHEYIPSMVTIRQYLKMRKQIHQDLLDIKLLRISELRKSISTG